MSSKIWNDVVGVSRGLWSVVQKAQTSNVRVARGPRLPTSDRLDNYSKRTGKCQFVFSGISHSLIFVKSRPRLVLK